MAEDNVTQAAAPRARVAKIIQAEVPTMRKVATLYPPVSPDLMAGMLSITQYISPGMPLGFGPSREVRVHFGKIELWERVPD